MTTHRLPHPHGVLLDRDRPMGGQLDGAPVAGVDGDTLMSALLAHGRHAIARSPVYGRPRGPVTLAGVEGNLLVRAGDGAPQPADGMRLTDGLTAATVSGPPARGGVAGLAQRLRGGSPSGSVTTAGELPAGEAHELHPDVAVLGGGPAGLAAAEEAAASGAGVLVIDEQPRLGGSLVTGRWGIEPGRGGDEARRLRAALSQRDNVRLLTGARCLGWSADAGLTAVRGGQPYRVRARQLVVATGVLEQPMVFRNNDLPGIMTGTAVQRALRLWGVAPGTRAVVCTVNPQGYAAALDLADAGVEVAAVLDLNEDHFDGPERRACEHRGMRVMPGHTVYEARAGRAGRHLGAVVIDALADHEGDVSHATERVACDLMVMSVGTAPRADIPAQAGATRINDTYHGTLLVEDVPAGMHLAGGLNGAHDLNDVLADGRRAGWAAAKALGAKVGPRPDDPTGPRPLVDYPWPIFPHPKGREFVDRDADVTVADVRRAAAEGADLDAVRRATGLGTGWSRGALSALNALRLAARARGESSGGQVL
ncbi:sarcosine oxidase subunit alpha [Limimonas halophila]|uniref:Sarcosine oxidase subunit alpha n=1 Tax=Limimonas halophila TaxID=1082479 RepID=A0A1G7TQL0_9PROT|nr:FAD-dependent oxidoreductase [Limimonas halophila]SDG37442.1 sarcosine oxidase subunit alpha [Limimonas halophila]